MNPILIASEKEITSLVSARADLKYDVKRWKYLENNFFTCISHDLKYDVRPVVASQEDAFFNFSAKLVAIAVRSYY